MYIYVVFRSPHTFVQYILHLIHFKKNLHFLFARFLNASLRLSCLCKVIVEFIFRIFILAGMKENET